MHDIEAVIEDLPRALAERPALARIGRHCSTELLLEIGELAFHLVLDGGRLARVVRGRFMALKDEDFIKSARLDGNRPVRIIRRHMVPNFLSHIIAVVTLAIPGMIIAETSLSFLGIGLRPPVVSWGVLLQEAQNLRSIATAPWLFLPGAAVVVAVLSLNFLGDGLRDAADPYAN